MRRVPALPRATRGRGCRWRQGSGGAEPVVAQAGGPARIAEGVPLRGAVAATCVVATGAAGAGAHWATLAPIAVPAVLVGPALPWRRAARLAGFAVVAAVLVGGVRRAAGTDAPAAARLAWSIGHSVFLAAVCVAAAAVRDRCARAGVRPRRSRSAGPGR
ncbi:hypothetical protein [Frankia sp. AgB32]|uniref:hypothetical protein n=1 Tax=Frankia sp. AgB32 TaxID=631119 RepID=UPI00200DC646|nr:hypothetical protein [Frankia sp. AgB32]MCK9895320.1 hypothetical protein [Frankia sp. AgB32]